MSIISCMVQLSCIMAFGAMANNAFVNNPPALVHSLSLSLLLSRSLLSRSILRVKCMVCSRVRVMFHCPFSSCVAPSRLFWRKMLHSQGRLRASLSCCTFPRAACLRVYCVSPILIPFLSSLLCTLEYACHHVYIYPRSHAMPSKVVCTINLQSFNLFPETAAAT